MKKLMLLICLLVTTAPFAAELKRCDLTITRLNSTDSITRPGGATVVDDVDRFVVMTSDFTSWSLKLDRHGFGKSKDGKRMFVKENGNYTAKETLITLSATNCHPF